MNAATVAVPGVPNALPPLALPVGSEVYARRRGPGQFVDSGMPKYWYVAAVPGILLAMLPGERYLVVLRDQDEVVVLERSQVWTTPIGRPHFLASE